MGTVNFVATSISEVSKTIAEKKFRTKDEAIFYLMNLISKEIFLKTESWSLDRKSDHSWRIIANAYDSLKSFIKYMYNGTVYQLKEVPVEEYEYSYCIYRNEILIGKSDEMFERQKMCYDAMMRVAQNYIGYGYNELFEYSPTEITTGNTIETIPSHYASRITIDSRPDSICIQYETPDDNSDNGSRICGHKYEIRMVEFKKETVK